MPTIKTEGRDRRDVRERRSTSRGLDPTVQQQAPDKLSGKAKTKEKTFMDRWVEPSLAAPKASYQEHGGVPYGVLEHMQPLGEAPNPKVKTRVKAEGTRKSVLGRSSAAAPDAQESPDGSPAPTAPSGIGAHRRQAPAIVENHDDAETDGDYAPQPNGKRKERSRRRTTAKREQPVVETKPKSKSKGKAKQQGLEFWEDDESMPPRPVYNETKLKRIVEAAKARAIEVGKPELAAAVYEIYEQSRIDLHLRLLLEVILLQTASPEQTTEFQGYVRAAKRKLKEAKANKSAASATPAREVPSSGTIDNNPNNTTTTIPSPSKLTLLPGPNITATSSALPSTEHSEPTKPKISLKLKSSAKEPSHRRLSLPTARMSISPRKRAGSAGSDSSLTSLTSNEEVDDMELDAAPATREDRLSSPPKVNGASSKSSSLLRTLPAGAAGSAGMKRSSAEAGLEADREAERDRTLMTKKQKLSEGIARDDGYYEESNVRPVIRARTTRAGPASSQAAVNGSLPLLKLSAPGPRYPNARESRAASMELDSPLSSVSTPEGSPRAWKGPPRLPGKRAKTKQSPEKKQLAGNSGMSGAGPAGVDSPIGDDDNEELSENNDFCAACGGSGYLLCCDGCDRSFHFSCLDPPLSEDAKELDEPWFCYVCVAKRALVSGSPEKPLRGLFAPLLGGLKKRNPANFMLPSYIRDYFEGVTTDRNGGFVEAVNKPTRNRPGYSGDRPDFKKLRDAKGVIIQCYACGLSSQGQREIIGCDFCSQHWHLDCLDPPLSNAPGLNQDGYKVHDWMCPLHVDQELRRVDAGLLSRRRVHIRRPKAAKVFETALSRGFRNNGIIEVVDDESDTSDSEFFDHDDGGTIYKLPASGIKLDFIDKVKATRVQQIRDERAHKRARIAATTTTTPSALIQANFAKRPFVEKQLALNLAQFSRDQQDLNLGSDQVETLVGALIAEAPAEVVREMTLREEAEKAKSASSAIPPSPPASEQPEHLSVDQRKELRMLQELIRRKLDSIPT